MAKNGVMRIRATRDTVVVGIVHTLEPGSAMAFWQMWCGSVMTLIDTGELVVLEDVNVHLRGIQPSVVVVRINTNIRQGTFFAT